MSSTVPQTMKAVRVAQTGGIENLQYQNDVPVPSVKENEVLVKNNYIGINYIDTYFRTGLYPPPVLPYTPGREASGTIAALGPNTPKDLQVGTRVVYMGQSSYAEYTAVTANTIAPLPEGVPDDIGAAALLQGLTALTLIRDAHKVEKGDWVLVTAAAGGVGLWLIQLLKAVGARTIAAASSEEKRQKAKDNGAEVTLGYHEEDREKFVQEVLDVTGGEGVNVVFDSVGQATFDAVLKTVKRKGSLVSFGNASGAVTGFALSRLSAKNVKLVRPTLFNYVYTREELLETSAELWKFIQKDGVKVHIHDTYPLEEVQRATKDIESRTTTGKLLLKP